MFGAKVWQKPEFFRPDEKLNGDLRASPTPERQGDKRQA
jgi:hypothetical protein